MRLMDAAAVAALAAGPAAAGGIERSTQSADILFEAGDRVELSFAEVEPSVEGETELLAPVGPGGTPADIGGSSGNVAKDFAAASAALKVDVSDRLAFAIIGREPFGADILYPARDPVLGGTRAQADTRSLTALMRYRITDRVSAFGGVRHDQADGAIRLSGAAYGPVDGYRVDLGTDTALGYVVGAAYEVPEIALRLSLTYNSEIEHEFDIAESGPLVLVPDLGAVPALNGRSELDVSLPQSVNLAFQTGVAEGTLVFGSVRWAEHSAFRVDPPRFGAVADEGLVDFEDTVTYRLGVGRELTDRLSGSVEVGYEEGGDELVSPLRPFTGFTELSVGAAYEVTETVKLSGGVSYRWLGDGTPETDDEARGEFTDNESVAVGLSVAYTF